jgi:hypothetical protein
VERVIEKLKALPEYLRVVRYAFICTDPSYKPKANSSPTTIAVDSHCPSNANDAGLPSLSVPLFIQLLKLLSPTLHMLSISSSPQHGGIPLLSSLFRTHFPFPQLHFLFVDGMYPYPSASSSPPSLSTLGSDYRVVAQARFPVLTCLHLHGRKNPTGLLQQCGLDKACPELRVLRVSGLGESAGFLREVEESVIEFPNLLASAREGEPEEDSEHVQAVRDIFPNVLPPKIDRLELQCSTSLSSPNSIQAPPARPMRASQNRLASLARTLQLVGSDSQLSERGIPRIVILDSASESNLETSDGGAGTRRMVREWTELMDEL